MSSPYDAVFAVARQLHPNIPAEIIDGLHQYVAHRIPTGSFLRAVLSNNLIGAVTRAHPVSLANLQEIVQVCLETVPIAAWGCDARVDAWLTQGPSVPDVLRSIEDGLSRG